MEGWLLFLNPGGCSIAAHCGAPENGLRFPGKKVAVGRK